MSEEQENKWREEFEELSTLQFDNLSQYEREEKIYLAACKKRQEEIEELKSLIKEAKPQVKKSLDSIFEIDLRFSHMVEYKTKCETWLEKAEKIQ